MWASVVWFANIGNALLKVDVRIGLAQGRKQIGTPEWKVIRRNRAEAIRHMGMDGAGDERSPHVFHLLSLRSPARPGPIESALPSQTWTYSATEQGLPSHEGVAWPLPAAESAFARQTCI